LCIDKKRKADKIDDLNTVEVVHNVYKFTYQNKILIILKNVIPFYFKFIYEEFNSVFHKLVHSRFYYIFYLYTLYSSFSGFADVVCGIYCISVIVVFCFFIWFIYFDDYFFQKWYTRLLHSYSCHYCCFWIFSRAY